MKKFLVALSFVLLAQQTALADTYITQGPSDSNATGMQNTQPQPGVDCPIGTRFCVWTMQSGDTYIGRYSIDAGGNQTYTPMPLVPSNYSIDDAGRLLYKGALIPDAAGFKRALNADPNIPDLAKVQLTPYIVLVDSYATDPEGTKAAWARVKKVLNLDPTIAGGIEAYAAAYGMPLN